MLFKRTKIGLLSKPYTVKAFWPHQYKIQTVLGRSFNDPVIFWCINTQDRDRFNQQRYQQVMHEMILLYKTTNISYNLLF